MIPAVLPFMILSLNACVSKPDPAPVVERQFGRYPAGAGSAVKDHADRKTYVVQRGDTLYSIALKHGVDVNRLSEMNNITDPRELRVGQEIDLYTFSGDGQISHQEDAVGQPELFSVPQPGDTGMTDYQLDVLSVEEGKSSDFLKTEPKGVILAYSDATLRQLENQTKTVPASEISGENSGPGKISSIKDSAASDVSQSASKTSQASRGINWGWPAAGQVVSSFSEKSKGVGIAGKLSQPVLASASGTVVYSGSGLRGYGNLVIIKHDDTYLSAYGHNNRVFVHEGERVSKGQKIAEMGNADDGTVKLHFEIRQKGKPIDPLTFLPSR